MKSRVTQALVLLLAVVVIATGCGSSGFHSATHHYSVDQVEAAFAAHGIELRKEAQQRVPAYVVLRSDKVLVTVVRTPKANRLPLTDLGFGPDTATHHGNVLVIYKPAQRAPVTAALAALH
jgi:hypothetical protein